MESLDRNQILKLIDLTKDFNAIGYRYVFRKTNNEKYKGVLVAKGLLRRRVLTIMRSSLKHTSIQMLLTIIAQFFYLELEQMNVRTMFLHGEMEEKIYMK